MTKCFLCPKQVPNWKDSFYCSEKCMQKSHYANEVIRLVLRKAQDPIWQYKKVIWDAI